MARFAGDERQRDQDRPADFSELNERRDLVDGGGVAPGKSSG